MKDRSRWLALAALALLFLVLWDPGGAMFGTHHFMLGTSWLKFVLLGALIWLIMTKSTCCCGCWGGSAATSEAGEEHSSSDDESAAGGNSADAPDDDAAEDEEAEDAEKDS